MGLWNDVKMLSASFGYHFFFFLPEDSYNTNEGKNKVKIKMQGSADGATKAK